MALRDLRFNFFPTRTFWTVVIVGLIVVGLFFIPEIINLKKSSSPKSTRTTAQSAKVRQEKEKLEQSVRASAGSERLKDVSTELDEEPKPEKRRAPAAVSEKKDAVHADLDKEGGFFSGLGKKIKARSGDTAEVPKGTVSLNEVNLTSKEGQALFKKGRAEVFRFYESLDLKEPSVRSGMYDFIGNLTLVANGLPKTVDPRDMQRHLLYQAQRVTEAMVRARVERGILMKWYEIQIVQILQTAGGDNLEAEIKGNFQPLIQLQSVAVRQKPLRPGMPLQATLKADFGVKGQDIERIEVFAGSEKQRDIRVGRGKPGALFPFSLRGDAAMPWTLVAYDKYGGRVFRKIYSFLPRMRRFPITADGTYLVAFRGGTTPSKLDRFFVTAISRRAPVDPAISTF